MTESHVTDLDDLRVVTDYQSRAGAGDALFPVDTDIELSRSWSGRPRQVHAEGDRVTSYGTDGRFTLGVAGGRCLYDDFDGDAYVVCASDKSVPFVRDGKDAFVKFVTDANPVARSGDEMCVVGSDDDLPGVGCAELSTDAMLGFQTGMAVHVHGGADEE